jgi:hypothetical protein
MGTRMVSNPTEMDQASTGVDTKGAGMDQTSTIVAATGAGMDQASTGVATASTTGMASTCTRVRKPPTHRYKLERVHRNRRTFLHMRHDRRRVSVRGNFQPRFSSSIYHPPAVLPLHHL